MKQVEELADAAVSGGAEEEVGGAAEVDVKGRAPDVEEVMVEEGKLGM